MTQRFLSLTDVAEELAISGVQARALVTSGELPAIQVGGRKVWRIEKSVLEEYIQDKYRENARRVSSDAEAQA